MKYLCAFFVARMGDLLSKIYSCISEFKIPAPYKNLVGIYNGMNEKPSEIARLFATIYSLLKSYHYCQMMKDELSWPGGPSYNSYVVQFHYNTVNPSLPIDERMKKYNTFLYSVLDNGQEYYVVFRVCKKKL